MTSTASTVFRITDAPEGIVRLFVADSLGLSKLQVRNAATKAAGTIHVGRVPVGKPATREGVKGHVYDFSPVSMTTLREEKAERTGMTQKSPALSRPADIPAAAWNVLTVEQRRALVGMSEQGRRNAIPDPAVVVKAAKAKGSKKQGKGKGSTFVRDVIAPRAAARAEAAKACPRCLGFGRERSVPRESGKYPFAFRTQRGADTAPTGKPCTGAAHGKGKGRKTA